MSFYIAKFVTTYAPIFTDEDGNEYTGPEFATEEDATAYAIAHA